MRPGLRRRRRRCRRRRRRCRPRWWRRRSRLWWSRWRRRPWWPRLPPGKAVVAEDGVVRLVVTPTGDPTGRVSRPSTEVPIARYAAAGSTGTPSAPLVRRSMVRPHSPPVVLTDRCQSRTPSVKPRSRAGSASTPRAITPSVTPGPVTSPSGVTGVMDAAVVVCAVPVRGTAVPADGNVGRSSTEVHPTTPTSRTAASAASRRWARPVRSFTRSALHGRSVGSSREAAASAARSCPHRCPAGLGPGILCRVSG